MLWLDAKIPTRRPRTTSARPTQTPTTVPSAWKSPPPDRPKWGNFSVSRNGRSPPPFSMSISARSRTRVFQLASCAPRSIPSETTTAPVGGSSEVPATRATKGIVSNPSTRRIARSAARSSATTRAATRLGQPSAGRRRSSPRLYRWISIEGRPSASSTCAAVSTRVSPGSEAITVPLPWLVPRTTITVGRNVTLSEGSGADLGASAPRTAPARPSPAISATTRISIRLDPTDMAPPTVRERSHKDHSAAWALARQAVAGIANL